MRHTHARRLFAVTIAAATAFALAACDDSEEVSLEAPDNSTDVTDTEQTDDIDSNEADTGSVDDDAAFSACTTLTIDVMMLGLNVSDMDAAELTELSDKMDEFNGMVSDPGLSDSSADLRDMLADAASDPSAYELGTQNAVDISNVVSEFIDGCSVLSSNG
ncbi:hypothetical protein [Natronoglycomyces albus]|uniref:Secreted protein n=1 Tax=Natronoglycomyces albus TaxID=2811108 RepID=A0A895XSU0_9ACTN|nr:hypothetical protein [Natronoglycomyces albus]QSB05330.1 hypothetical protein JQS30_16535 [Natronoglycomyces albus]